MGNKRSFHGIIRGLSEQGFVAATVQYRFAPGARHPAQVEDIRSAVGFLRESAARWKADPAKVVLMGASAGGHLALLAGLPSAALPSPVQAIVDISGPTDLRDWKMNENAERTLRETTGKTTESLLSDLLGTAARDAEIVRRASPVTLVNSKSPPVLIFHWKEDQAVALSQAERLVTALSAARVQHEIIRFEGRGHALNGPGVEQIVPLTVRFLRRVLH